MTGDHDTMIEGRGEGVHIGIVKGDIVNSLIAGRDIIVNAFSPIEKAAKKARFMLIERVDEAWIAGLMRSRLGARTAFDVPSKNFRRGRPDPVDLEPGDIAAAQHLLVLGEPGAGKTMYVMGMLCHSLADAADLLNPVPVMIAASAWRRKLGAKDGKNKISPAAIFREWLIHRVQTDYKINPRVVTYWLESAELVLYLDGLDEIDEQFRADFVDCLHAFQHEETIKIRLSCRAEEYRKLVAERQFGNPSQQVFASDITVHLAPLTDDHVVAIAQSRGVVATIMPEDVDEDGEALWRSPLFLTLMLDIAEHDHLPLTSISSRDEVFDNLVDHAVLSRGENLARASLVSGLAAMAHILYKRHAPTFHYADLDMNRFDRHWQSGLVIAVGLAIATGSYFSIGRYLGLIDPNTQSYVTMGLFGFYGSIGGMGLLFITSKTLHQGFVIDFKRAAQGLLIASGIALVFAVVQLAVFLVDVAYVGITFASPIGFLVVWGLIVLVALWIGFIEGVGLGNVFAVILFTHLVAVIPVFVLGWFMTNDPVGVVHRLKDVIWLTGAYLHEHPHAPPWRVWGKILWFAFRGDLVFLVVCGAGGILIGALRPRPMDRFTRWTSVLGHMALSAIVLSGLAAVLVAAIIALVQLSFGHHVAFDGRVPAIIGVGIIGLAAGGGVAIVYYALCFILLSAGRTVPWRMPAMLEEGVRLGLIVRVAGSFAFLHRLEMEYFAAKYRRKGKMIRLARRRHPNAQRSSR